MDNGIVVKSYEASGSLKGSDVLAMGADTIIVKKKNVLISVNPVKESEAVAFTYNDQIKVIASDRFVFDKKIPILLSNMGNGAVPLIGGASFTVSSSETLVCPSITTPSILASMSQVREINGFEIDIATMSIKNISGRTLTMVGDVGIQFIQTGAQPAIVHVISEHSDDGINWTYNESSLREESVEKTGIMYMSIPSFNIDDWIDGRYIRFRFAKTGVGGVTLLSPSAVLSGNTVTGQTFVWTMRER